MAKKAKRKLARSEAKKAIPLLKEFNEISKSLINALNRKILSKERRLNKISVMVSAVKIPTAQHNINIRSVGIAKSKKKRAESRSFNPFEKWEDDLNTNRKKWII